jgi:hypothetical protein
MAPSVFHQFSRLPVELRLQIWEAACVGPPASHRSLQYVNVLNDRVVAMPCSWPKPPEQIVTAKVNRSAYLIDGGLWRACKESREVIAKSTHFEDWVRIQKRSIFDFKYYTKYNARRFGGNKPPHPAFINTCEGEEECRMLVYPTNDIFCIQVYDRMDLQEPEFFPDIYMLLNLYKRNDRENDDENRYGWPKFQRLYLKNVAFEFDSSWLVDLPDSKYALMYENSARGYLASLLDEKAYHHRYTYKKGEGIWIVDKETKWYSLVDEDEDHDNVDEDEDHDNVDEDEDHDNVDEDEDHDNVDKHDDTVFWDCDGEYIQVYEEDFSNRRASILETTNVREFISRIWSMGIGDHYPDWEADRYGPEPCKMVRILVRRDNELKLFDRTRKKSCSSGQRRKVNQEEMQT